MAITLTYAVHDAHDTTTIREVKFGDRTLPATIPAFVVELIEPDHGHTFRFVPGSDEQAEELRALFTPGAAITVTFSAGA